MKVTKRQIKRIIREEYRKIVRSSRRRSINENRRSSVLYHELDPYQDGGSFELGFIGDEEGDLLARISVNPALNTYNAQEAYNLAVKDLVRDGLVSAGTAKMVDSDGDMYSVPEFIKYLQEVIDEEGPYADDEEDYY